jgi:hypothetical protein
MKRLLTLIALLGFVVGVFSGCSPGGGDNSSAATNAPAAPASTNK